MCVYMYYTSSESSVNTSRCVSIIGAISLNDLRNVILTNRISPILRSLLTAFALSAYCVSCRSFQHNMLGRIFFRLATWIHCSLVNTRYTARRATLWLARCAHVALPAGAAMQWHVYTYWRLHHGIIRRGSHNRASLKEERETIQGCWLFCCTSQFTILFSCLIFFRKKESTIM